MALCDVQFDQQGGHGLGAHGSTSVGVQREHAALHIVARDRIRALSLSEHPAHHVTTVDIQNHVQVEAGPFERPLEFRDVPRPYLIRTPGSNGTANRLK
jgi:hypothetical protein